jgi:hypothetical protein
LCSDMHTLLSHVLSNIYPHNMHNIYTIYIYTTTKIPHYFSEFIPQLNCYLPQESVLDVFPNDWNEERLKEAAATMVNDTSQV